ncbi:hypothetical protein LR032_05385 [Candidatus Bipolaricaulota bacterium]|nr:hypothetical protein [Candidatus Bipolaricaulota bacterium]
MIFNKCLNEFARAILASEEYEGYEQLRAYFEALRLSKKLARLKVDLSELLGGFRQELEGRGPGPVVIDANVLLAFYLPAEPYKTQAFTLLGDAAAVLVKLVMLTLATIQDPQCSPPRGPGPQERARAFL